MVTSLGMNRASRKAIQFLTTTGLVLAATTASAEDPCDQTTLLCSTGSLPQYAESYDRLPGASIDTNWMPACSPATSNGHCSNHKIQVRAQIAFDKIKDGGPVYSVDMKKGTRVDARWPTTDMLDLTLPAATANDATFRVAHTITPEFSLYIDTPVFKGELNLDASTLINFIPGSAFNYRADSSVKFKPWAFGPVDLTVKPSGSGLAQLFSIKFDDIGKVFALQGLDDYVNGKFAFSARTETNFKYSTTSVSISGSTGPILEADGMTQVVSPDGDYLETTASTVGTIRYDGTIELLPVIVIDKIGPVSVNLTFPISVGLTFPYTSGNIPVTFQSENIHIPLPNVFVPSTPLNFGTVDTGGSSEPKKVRIENTGELGAILEFKTSDDQFKLSGYSWSLGPDGDDYQLTITFRPTKPGKQSGKIIVESNDPDSPVQEIMVTGVGDGGCIDECGCIDGCPCEDHCTATGGSGGGGNTPGTGGRGRPPAGAEPDDGGCGCRVPSSAGSAVGATAFLAGLLALGLRRRRSAL
ncbi:MAG: choice-of-anchor D domain-containing protein [Polyangiaceae bacterium]|nr:choice-of-anchor D domain-containing protein [Polyangiaceae bacterium]